MILAAGLGKRMKSYTKKTPKPLIKINNETLIEKIIKIKDGNHSLSRKKDLRRICSELKKMIEANGGKVTGSISAKTNYLVAGENMGPSKLAKAEKVGTTIISEDEFLAMVE